MVKSGSESRELLSAVCALVVVPIKYLLAILRNIIIVQILGNIDFSFIIALDIRLHALLTSRYCLGKEHTIRSTIPRWLSGFLDGTLLLKPPQGGLRCRLRHTLRYPA